MSIVFTVGVFDLFHYGHEELFRRAKKISNDNINQSKLIVAVQDGNYIKKYKPETNIIYSTKKRVALVSNCKYVDKVILYKSVDEIVKNIDFDIFIVGEDQVHKGFQIAKEYCLTNGKKVISLTRTKGISSSILRVKLRSYN